MSAVAGLQSPRLRTLRPRAPALAASPRLALLGTGTVGAAWVERYTRLQGAGIELPALAWLANSRAVQPAAGDLATMLEQANAAPRRERVLQGWAEAEALQAGDILVDATASDTVADSSMSCTCPAYSPRFRSGLSWTSCSSSLASQLAVLFLLSRCRCNDSLC